MHVGIFLVVDMTYATGCVKRPSKGEKAFCFSSTGRLR